MKSIYLALACVLLLGGAFAQSVPQTPNIHLNEPPYHYQRWDIPNNANWTLLDSFWGSIGGGCGGDGSHGIGWDPVLHFQCVGIVGTNAPGGTNGQLQYNNAGALGGFNDGTAHQVQHGLRTFSAVTGLDTDSTIAQTGVDINTSFQVTSLHLSTPCSIAMGCTGTATPGLVAGSNITVTGSWPNQTITSLAGGPGGSTTQVEFNDSGTHGGNSAFTFNKSSGIASSQYMATSRGPYIDPKASPYNCVNDGTTDDTTCFQAALTASVVNHGTLICRGPYKLDRITLVGTEYILGTGDINANGCTITVKTDAVFVPATPASFLSGVTIKNIKFIGGTSPIDFGQANDVHVENATFFNNTTCGVVWVYGERGSMVNLTGVHTGNNGLATLCTGDKTKSLFSASISVTGAPARSYFRGIFDLGGLNGGTNYDQYAWWGGQGVGGGLTTSQAYQITCFFSCTQGVIWMDVLTQSLISNIDLDHVGQSGAHETIAVNIATSMYASRIEQYYPAFNTNYADTQLSIGDFESSTIADSWFCIACDNSATFGLKLTWPNTNTGSLDNVRGTVFSSNRFSGPTIIGGFLDVTNTLGGQQFVDNTNNGFYFDIYNNASAATGPYKFCRMAAGFTNTCDFTSNGSLLKLGERLMTTAAVPACTFTSGGGTSPSCTLDTGSSDNAGIIIATTGTGSPAGLGTITLTFSSTFGTNKPSCIYMADSGGAGTWNGLAVMHDVTPSTSSDLMGWNNGTGPSTLSTSTAYWINYQCWAK